LSPGRSTGRALSLAAVIVAAAGLRLAAVGFGPGSFEARPDENGVVLGLAALEVGEFSPGLVLYGGGYFYPLDVFVRAWGAWAWPDGVAARVRAGDFHSVRVAARVWSALLSTLTVALTFVLARRLSGWRAGLVAAAMVAVAPLAVREAHFAKADTAAAAALTLVLGALVLPRERSVARAVGIGVATAVALGTKAMIGVLPAVVLGLARPPGARVRRVDGKGLAVGLLAGAVTMAALNPFVLRWPGLSWTSARLLAHALSTADWLPGADVVPGPLAYHATISLRYGCGLAWALLAVPALAFGLVAGEGLRLVALAVLGHWAVLLASPMVLARFFLPAVPGLAVLTAALLVAAIDRLRLSRRGAGVALAAAAALVVAEPLVLSTATVRLLARDDTRVLAGRWIEAHLPPDAPIVTWGAPPRASEFGRPPLGGRPVRPNLPPGVWARAGVAAVVWHHYPLPYSSEELPPAAAALPRLATFDPFRGDPGSLVLEPLDAFYLPMAGLGAVERPGPRIEILAVAPSAPHGAR
jgi:4-amino-4-deoxy-L-arabinose transferase-like glycosyltransferase